MTDDGFLHLTLNSITPPSPGQPTWVAVGFVSYQNSAIGTGAVIPLTTPAGMTITSGSAVNQQSVPFRVTFNRPPEYFWITTHFGGRTLNTYFFKWQKLQP